MKKIYMSSFVFFVLFLFVTHLLTAQTITTFAGRAGYLGDGGQAVNAIIANPYSISMDAAGNIYIASAGDGHIRKINAATQVISTYAGNTGAVYYGDGGPATGAYFNFAGASGLALDAAGNMYIGDAGNNRIRKITLATGVVNTIAGTGTAGYSGDNGAAVNAKINGAEGIAVDVNGNVYFSDTKNNVIRRINVNTKKITTVVGIYHSTTYSGDGDLATKASIGYVERIALDAQGNLYLADGQNNVIRKIDASTNIITTIAGTGTAGYTGDNGPATAARLNGLMGIAIDALGNVYLTDRVNSVVRKISAGTQVITTVAGSGTGGFSGDGGAATSAKLDSLTDINIDNLGNLCIDDYVNNRIRRVDGITQNISTIGGVGMASPPDFVAPLESNFYFPAGLTFDTAGNLYTADFFKIRKINPSFNIITSVAGGGMETSVGGPATSFDILYTHSVIADKNNNLYFTDEPSHRVIMVDGVTQNVSLFAGNGNTDGSGDGGPATAAGIRPLKLAIDQSNNVYISDINFRIWKVGSANGKITAIAGTGTAGFSGDGGPATEANLNSQGMGVAVDKAGNVYIADAYNYRVRKVDASTGIITTIAGNGTSASTGDNGPAASAGLTMPRAITLNDSGDIYIADGNRIRKIDATTNVITTVAGSDIAGYVGDNGPAAASLLDSPYDIQFDKKGDLYVADFGNHVIRRITSATLPLTWLSFNGFANKNNVVLNWQTAAEVNTSHFDIQRSIDGATFGTIGHVNANGNVATTTSYSYTDINAIQAGNTLLLYRLVEIDKDGKANYSRIIRVNLNSIPFSVKISPNPVADNINIYPNSNAGLASVTLVDANGKVMQRFTQTLTAGQPVHINAARLAKGIYYVIVNTADAQARMKIVK